MSFVWFWTFWHWSKESFRDGLLLRSPLHGVGGHWDEWFRHEASESDRHAVERVGRSEALQRRFIGWLLRRWASEAGFRRSRSARHFILGQLAHVQPFNEWAAFEEFRTRYRIGGISAIVLAEKSSGEPDDVRVVEALALPADPTAPAVVAEGFQADSIELETPRRAAMSLLQGKGLLVFLALWIAGGQRPYPPWLRIAFALGWLAVCGLILYLLAGPEPGERLFLLCAMLVALWSGLVLVAGGVTSMQCLHAWRQGRSWCAWLEENQVRLRMRGGLTIKGGSAGLPFCLNTVLSLRDSEASSTHRSWLWERLFRKLRREADVWAATGAITADGYLKPVMLEAKLHACIQHGTIKHLLIPRQPGESRRAINRVANSPTPPRREAAPTHSFPIKTRLGFAAEQQFLRVHPCRHAAQALMRLGEFTSTRQMALNVLAVVVSIALLLALPDLRGILRPPPAPVAVVPSSPSPYHLWVSLDTKHPEYFQVALDSRYWSNRRALVAAYGGANAPVRAEMRLQRVAVPTNSNEEDGVVWLERRHRFLIREFAPGERVGRYTVSYLNRLGHE